MRRNGRPTPGGPVSGKVRTGLASRACHYGIVESGNAVLVGIDGPIATVTLNRPDQLNAITLTMLEELAASLGRVASAPEVRIVILQGAGRAFSAGVDLKALGGRSIDGGAIGEVFDTPARRVIEWIVSMPKIVIAKVHGYCFTGALELAMACDLILAAEDATFGDTHARFGLRPTWGMSQRLIRSGGIARARALSYTARRFTGSDAAAWGLVTSASRAHELDSALADLTTSILENSQGSLIAYKDLYRKALDSDLASGLEYEASADYAITDTEERVAAFR
jgi:enoyl-CoA hydratase